MTDAWDPSKPEHKELAHRIEYGNGIPCMRPISESIDAFNTVGFEILHKDDLADRDDPVTWYHTLEGDLSKAQTWYDMIASAKMTRPVRRFAQWMLTTLEKISVVPPGTAQVGETLIIALLALVEGGQKKVCLNSLRDFAIAYTDSLRSYSHRCCSLLLANLRRHRLLHFLSL